MVILNTARISLIIGGLDQDRQGDAEKAGGLGGLDFCVRCNVAVLTKALAASFQLV
jgi:hypothetical protein